MSVLDSNIVQVSTLPGTVATDIAASKADNDTIATNSTTLAGAVTGTKLRVSVVDALPTSANVIGHVVVDSVPATAPTTDWLVASLDTSKIGNGLTQLTPKFAKITASSSGATTIVSLVSSKKLRVLAWSLVCNAAVNVKWQTHATPTDLTGLHYFAANGGIQQPFNPVGYFETVAGEALDINLSGAIAVGGSLVYIEV